MAGSLVVSIEPARDSDRAIAQHSQSGTCCGTGIECEKQKNIERQPSCHPAATRQEVDYVNASWQYGVNVLSIDRSNNMRFSAVVRGKHWISRSSSARGRQVQHSSIRNNLHQKAKLEVDTASQNIKIKSSTGGYIIVGWKRVIPPTTVD